MIFWDEKSASEMAQKIIRSYAKKGVRFEIKKKIISPNDSSLKFRIKVLPTTRTNLIYRYAKDVRLSLKLPLLDIVEEDAFIFIVISKKMPKNRFHLFEIMRSPEYAEALKTTKLIHPIGVNVQGDFVIEDLTEYPHALVSGTTCSGKSVALRCLLLNLAYQSPQKVNLLIGDKANDLSPFANLPHLSHPIIKDFDTFLKVILILKDEMNSRLSMTDCIEEFDQLPFIVCVIDEFNSLINETQDSWKAKLAVDALTVLLRMGRHARIHLILASHNPTKANIKIDTSDLPVRIVFQVSKLHNSLTALDEGGAEKLRGKGDMLFKERGGVQHLQGVFVSSEEIDKVLCRIRCSYQLERIFANLGVSQTFLPRGVYGFTVSEADLQRKEAEIQEEGISLPVAVTSQHERNNGDTMFANVILWSLGQDTISCNQISETFNVGWRRANGFIKRLNDLKIVGELDAKLPRKVLPQSMGDISTTVMEFLGNNGISEEQVTSAFDRK